MDNATRVPAVTKHTLRKDNILAKVNPLSQWQLLSIIDSTAGKTRRNSTSQQTSNIFHIPLLIPRSQLSYQVERLMYCFHESLPASRPPPVAFSPPKAPPISAPFVGMFTLTIPQSLPRGLHQIRTS